MGIAELLIISAGLAMDAFSAAVCEGVKMKRINYFAAFLTALFFGVFQAVMPLSGYFLGNRFAETVHKYNHWIAFVLLVIIGSKMIFETFHTENNSKTTDYRINIKELTALAIATSIDALAVGVVFAAQKCNITISVIIIGTVTAVLSFIGVAIGNSVGTKYEKKAEICGGIVLILIGIKMLVERFL